MTENNSVYVIFRKFVRILKAILSLALLALEVVKRLQDLFK